MRAGLGILSLLVCVAIILFVMYSGPGGGYMPTALKAGHSAQSQAQQLSGRNENGMPVQDTIGLKEVDKNGNEYGLKVHMILPTCPLISMYGLQKGDVITQVGPLTMREENDPEMMKDQVYEAGQQGRSIVIERDGKKLTLQPHGPLQEAHPGLFPKAQQPTDQSSPLQQQLKAIQQIPTH